MSPLQMHTLLASSLPLKDVDVNYSFLWTTQEIIQNHSYAEQSTLGSKNFFFFFLIMEKKCSF